jgi:hypothetical protein
MMHGHEESDPAIVAAKPANKTPISSVQPGEHDGRGVGGAKGGDQGECGPAKHAPDAEPDQRDTGVGLHTRTAPAVRRLGS